MEKIIFFSLVIPIFGFVLYLGGNAIMKGMSAKNANKESENLENNEIETGISIHYVSENYDSGEIIFQKKIQLNRDDTAKTVEKKIHILEYEFYPQVIQSLLNE